MSVIYKNDIGTELILDCGVTISTATVMKVRARNPNGALKEWGRHIEQHDKHQVRAAVRRHRRGWQVAIAVLHRDAGLEREG
jgi:hypothetical protein